MASPYPLVAYWELEPVPTLEVCARALLAALHSAPIGARFVTNTGNETEGNPATVLRALETGYRVDVAGFSLDLPAAIALFANGSDACRREFGVSGADNLARFGASEQLIVAETVKTVMETLVGRLGAVAAWCGAYRSDHILEPWDRFDQAMAARHPGAPLPLSIVASPAAWLTAWRSDIDCDVRAVSTNGRVRIAGDLQAVPF